MVRAIQKVDLTVYVPVKKGDTGSAMVAVRNNLAQLRCVATVPADHVVATVDLKKYCSYRVDSLGICPGSPLPD